MNRTGKVSIGDRLMLLAAVALSTVWVVLIALYLRSLHGAWSSLSPAEAAGLFAGAAGPLAALWLFMAVVEQRHRLSMMTQALGELLGQNRHSLQLAETQTRALVEFQNQAKSAQGGALRQLALQDLAASVAVLSERLGVLRREDVDVTWARFGSGDIAAFVHPFLAFATSHPEITERLAEAVTRDQLAAAALHAFVRRYERLLASEDRTAQEILDEGPLGRAFRLFKPASGGPRAPAGAGEIADLQQGRSPQDQLAALSERLEASAPSV